MRGGGCLCVCVCVCVALHRCGGPQFGLVDHARGTQTPCDASPLPFFVFCLRRPHLLLIFLHGGGGCGGGRGQVARGLGVLLDAGWRPKRTIAFGSWDGEEFG
jgi:hypothetical protein